MPEEFSFAQPLDASQPGKKLAHPSSDKSVRTMLLAVLFQVSWPTRLTRDEIIQQLPMYGEHPNRALYRDIETLTGIQVENLPEPTAEGLDVWCAEQQKRKRLALTYERLTKTFGLAQSLFSLDINEDEARASVALQEGFGPGTPYADEYRDGHWYYTAYIRDLNTFIDYRVDRIRPGTLRKDHDRFYPGIRQRPGVKIRYWVSPMLARHGSLSARLREQHVTMLDDDQGAIVEGYAKSVWWARRLLLSYGEQVKALEPEKLVLMMRETTQTMYRMYEEEK